MKKLKNELKKIMAFVMFATFVVTMFPTTALAVEVTDEVNYTQRSIDTTEDENIETEEELGEEEEPQEPGGDKGDSETPGEEEKPEEPDKGKNEPVEEKKDEASFDESKVEDSTGVKEKNESNKETPIVQSQITEQNKEILDKETLKQAPNNFTPEQANTITYEIPKTGDKDSIMLDIAMVIATMSLTAIAMLSTYKRKKQK